MLLACFYNQGYSTCLQPWVCQPHTGSSLSWDFFTTVPFPCNKVRLIGLEAHQGAAAQCPHSLTEETGPERAGGCPHVTELASQKAMRHWNTGAPLPFKCSFCHTLLLPCPKHRGEDRPDQISPYDLIFMFRGRVRDGEGRKGLKSIKENSTLKDLCDKLKGKAEQTHLK